MKPRNQKTGKASKTNMFRRKPNQSLIIFSVKLNKVIEKSLKPKHGCKYEGQIHSCSSFIISTRLTF